MKTSLYICVIKIEILSQDKTITYTLPSINSTSVLDLISKILSHYSTYFITSGKGLKPLSSQLIRVLSIYVLYGYNRESKNLAVEICQLKNANDINVLNKQLRDAGYIVKSFGNDRISHLNEDLKPLSEGLNILDKNIPELKSKGVKNLKLSLEFDLKLP